MGPSGEVEYLGSRVPYFKLKLGGKTMALLDGEHDVGRMSDCWLTLDDELTSRYHARFHVNGPSAEVEDLGSRNGTYVNGEKLQGRRPLQDGDRIRIGRELIAVLVSETSHDDGTADLRRTLAPGEETRFPTLIGQLVEKSIKVGKLRDAERYATALLNQMQGATLEISHPAAQATVRCLLKLAEHTSSGIWIDRLFRLATHQGWVMTHPMMEEVRAALDRIPRVPGTGIKDYEHRLRALERDGTDVSPSLRAAVAELADAYTND